MTASSPSATFVPGATWRGIWGTKGGEADLRRCAARILRYCQSGPSRSRGLVGILLEVTYLRRSWCKYIAFEEIRFQVDFGETRTHLSSIFRPEFIRLHEFQRFHMFGNATGHVRTTRWQKIPESGRP